MNKNFMFDPIIRKWNIVFATIALLNLCSCVKSVAEVKPELDNRPRIIVTADPELDDLNSLIRFLLYSSDMQIEGLVYASSGYHWKGDGKGTKGYVEGREYTRYGLDICPCESWRWSEDERFIHDAVEAYQEVYPNLKIHNPRFPKPEDLLSKIRTGNVEFDGDISKDTPGSELIKSLILDSKPGPLYITAWGGQSTIARALKSIQEEYEGSEEWLKIKDKVSHKVVLLPSGDQDDTYRNYIKPNWPRIDYRQFSGGPHYAYGAQINASPRDSIYLTPEWLKKNILDRGPLGSLYRVWGDGKQMVEDDIFDYFGLSGYTNEQLKEMGYIVWMPVQAKGSWLGEGDSTTFMNMLGNGLRAYEGGSFGGWGGRPNASKEDDVFGLQARDTTIIDTTLQGMMSTLSSLTSKSPNKEEGFKFPNFFPAAQRDFAARLKWSVTPAFKDANHEPKVKINGPLQIKGHTGETINVTGEVLDPDGDQVDIKWWIFPSRNYQERFELSDQNTSKISFVVPKNMKVNEPIHLIMAATDNGSPRLTRYQRVTINISE